MSSAIAPPSGRRGGRVVAALLLLVGVAVAVAVIFEAGSGAGGGVPISCDVFASPNGSDGAAGTAAQPLRSVQRLVDSLAPGQTGCLRAGAYASDDQVEIAVPRITLASYPGERASLRGRLWVKRPGDGATVAYLDLDGRNARDLPSPTINADDVVLRGNEITNGHTEICLSIGSRRYGRAERTSVEENEIHDCGELPATNKDHGIYVNSADETVIRGNWIHDNADRGVQLYPDAQRTLVTGNVIDRNGEGVIFGGDERTASSDNVVEGNVITNSTIRYNVESSWEGPIGSGNVARGNCVGGGGYDEGNGAIGDVRGFVAVSNYVIEDPSAPGDFGASLACPQALRGG